MPVYNFILSHTETHTKEVTIIAKTEDEAYAQATQTLEADSDKDYADYKFCDSENDVLYN